ncbi:MAG: peptidoglycan DD-metalloendopeptidase family protein [Acidimicrobiales bacterium]|nr:peptidoglycan DD-metalloendopeptidase family protein [Acidimicrobiales bacterium]
MSGRRALYRMVFAAVAFSVLAGSAAAVPDTDDIREARDKREDAKDRAASTAEELELVKAEDIEVADALQALDDYVALQKAKIAAARQAIEAAEAEATLRWVEAEQVSDEIVELRAQLQRLAVDAYVGAMRAGTLLEAEELSTGLRMAAILDVVTGDRGDLLERLRALESDSEDIARSADGAIIDAEEQERELESSVLLLARRIAAQEAAQEELAKRITSHEQEIREFEREQYRMAILIDNLIAEELRRSAPKLTEKSASGFIFPVEGRITSGFGLRTHPIFGSVRQHNGLDFDCVTGQPIWSAKAGSVIFAGWRDGYGNVVLIEHEGYVVTVYAHQSKLSVSKGHSLEAGDPIGECGSTGWSTGPHLHFEVRVGGEPKDPLLVLPA